MELDALTPLLRSLMIGNPYPTTQPEPKPEQSELQSQDSQLEMESGHPAPQLWVQSQSVSQSMQPAQSQARPEPETDGKPQMECVCCKLPGAPCVLSCCARKICGPCLAEALNASIQNDVWHSLGSPHWVACLAKSCRTLKAPQDIVVDSKEVLSSYPAAQRALTVAQSTREALENIQPRPARREGELAQRLHKALTDLHLMSFQEMHANSRAVSATLYPVRSGFLTQPVPILTGLLKTESKVCTSCSAPFQAVDSSNQATWSSVYSAFPGDWSWMILGRPSKSVLPECAEKHSLDICPTCLPKLLFSGLEFPDGMSGGSNYRFVCPLCKHTFSPVQVERLARLIAPGRTPVSLSGISISAGFLASSLAKPTGPPKTALPFLGTPNKGKGLGALSKPAQPDDSSSVHKEALMSSIVSKKPNVKWDDVAGLTPAKHELQRAIVFPARFPNLYDEKRKASGAILLYGPPGTGKSYLAKAVATEVDHTLFSISSGDVVSKWVGESEKLVRQLFTLARENKPSIIFIDEIDALCANREGGGGSERGSEHSSRMKTEILVQLDGLHSGSDNTGVVVLAATNLPWALDPAFRRRFEPRIYIPLPDKDARRQLFGIHSGKWGEMLSEGDLEELAEMTEGFSGSDIANVIKHALSVPLQKAQGSKWFKVVRIYLSLYFHFPPLAIPNITIITQTTDSGIEMYTPCEPDEPGAIDMTWEKVPKNGLWDLPATAADFKQVLRDRKVKSSVGVGELQKYVDWTREFGVEGSS